VLGSGANAWAMPLLKGKDCEVKSVPLFHAENRKERETKADTAEGSLRWPGSINPRATPTVGMIISS